MAGIKVELDEYLSRKDDTKPLINGLPKVTIPKVGSWFRREQVEEEGWFVRTQKDCCFEMVSSAVT